VRAPAIRGSARWDALRRPEAVGRVDCGLDLAEAAEVAAVVRAQRSAEVRVGVVLVRAAVAVPLEPRGTWEEMQGALEAIRRELARRMPDAVTVERLKLDRGARIYVDSVMTTASAYSIRPTPTATVSAPVTWDELPGVRPEDFDVRTMPPRFARLGDLHAGLDDHRGALR
jgi:DNA primase